MFYGIITYVVDYCWGGLPEITKRSVMWAPRESTIRRHYPHCHTYPSAYICRFTYLSHHAFYHISHSRESPVCVAILRVLTYRPGLRWTVVLCRVRRERETEKYSRLWQIRRLNTTVVYLWIQTVTKVSNKSVYKIMEYSLGYREVVPDQTLPEIWKEIILNTGELILFHNLFKSSSFLLIYWN